MSQVLDARGSRGLTRSIVNPSGPAALELLQELMAFATMSVEKPILSPTKLEMGDRYRYR